MIRKNLEILNNELSLELAIQENYLLDEICQNKEWTETFYSFRKLNKKLKKYLKICNKIDVELGKNQLTNPKKINDFLNSFTFNASEISILHNLDLVRKERIKDGFLAQIEKDKNLKPVPLEDLNNTCSDLPYFISHIQQSQKAMKANDLAKFKLLIA